MRRAIFGSFTLGCLLVASASGQEVDAQADQASRNALAWLSLLVTIFSFVFGFFFLVFVIIRRRGTVGRSLQLAEELVRAAKTQVALQEETNRLLGQLLDARGPSDPK